MKKDDNEQNYIFGSVLIAAVTLLSYSVALSYKYGFASYYSIPLSYQSISIIDIFIACTVVFVAVIAIKSIVDLLEITKQIGKTAIGRYRFRHLIILLIGLIMSINQTKIKVYVLLALYTISIILIEIVSTYIHGKGYRSWKEKRLALESAWSNEKQPEDPKLFNNLLGNIFSWISHISFDIIVSLVLACIFSYNIGLYAASRQTDFYIIKDDIEYIEVLVDETKVIAVELDRSNMTFHENYRIFSLSDLSKNKYVIKKEKLDISKNLGSE